MIDTDFLRELNRFNLIVTKRITSNYAGPRRSYATGHGMLFKDHRMYTPGDDIRAIDWRVYARTENYYLKNYEEERSMTVHILVDSSSSMNYGKPYTKFEFASMIGVGFAYLALKENEKFKFSTFDEHVATFRSSRGRGHLAAMVHYLNSMKPRGKGNFKESMDSYRKYIKGKSVVIIISDFLTDPDIVEKAMVNFAKQEVKVIQVLDRVEKDMLLQGDLRLEDLESNSTMRTYISARLREEYKNRLNDHTAKIRQGCHRFGAHFEQVISDEPIFDAFFRILR